MRVPLSCVVVVVVVVDTDVGIGIGGDVDDVCGVGGVGVGVGCVVVGGSGVVVSGGRYGCCRMCVCDWCIHKYTNANDTINDTTTVTS